MKKNAFRLAAAVITAAIMLAMLAGCKSGDGEDAGGAWDMTDYVYIGQTVPLPRNVGEIGNLTFAGGKAYFTAADEDYAELSIYSMDIDGTNLTRLAGYAPPIAKPANADGFCNIQKLAIDSGGNIWVVEEWTFFVLDLPDGFDYDNDDLWEHAEIIESGSAVRKLDSAGAELLAIDLGSIRQQQEHLTIRAFTVDDAENIYLCAWDIRSGSTIYVLDKSGSSLLSIPFENYFDEFVRLPDGSIAVPTVPLYEYDNRSQSLQTIDVALKAFGETIELPALGRQVYGGGGSFDIIVSDGADVCGYMFGEAEAARILNWRESGVINNSIRGITLLADGRIACANYIWDNAAQKLSPQILVLTKTPYSELPEKTVLTLATLYLDYVTNIAITEFNSTNPYYRIEVTDYSQFNTENDQSAGLARLTTEIISGKVPDILCTNALPYAEYAKKGFLADLYPLIEADPVFSRSSFVESALRAGEVDGGLYMAFSGFYINTIIGHPSVVGSEMGWTMEEFISIIDAHPEADIQAGFWLTKLYMLRMALTFCIDKYINLETGAVSFDAPDFIELLKLVNRFPGEVDWMDINYDEIATLSPYTDIPSGRQIMLFTAISDFYTFQDHKAIFGGDIAFKGFPTERRNGNNISPSVGVAIASSSPNKEGAWAFARTFFEEDRQLGNYGMGFPTNKAAFDRAVKNAMETDYENANLIFGLEGAMVSPLTLENLTQEDAERIMALIDSASVADSRLDDEAMWALISESAADYFRGTISAQDAARVIQSRVAIYVSERS